MKKQLGIFATVLALCTTALIWSGCSESQYCGDQQPSVRECPRPCPPPCPPHPVCAPKQVCPPKPCPPPCPPKPVCPPKPCPPACPPKPVCPPPCDVQPIVADEPLCKLPPKCHYGSSFEMQCVDGITVSARQPEKCLLGDQYPFDIDVHACKDVCDVVVKVHVPEGTTIVSSNPEGQVHEGGQVVFNVGSMNKGDCQALKLNLRCDSEGELCACVCATAVPVRFCSLLCAKPVLTCEKCGPLEACPGDTVDYSITVTNRGSATAEEVVVTDQIPPEMEHASGQKSISIKLGNLAPCETKKVNVCMKAVKRGKACNTVTVTACNADTVSCQACTNICKLCVECNKNGPKEVQIGKNADYTVTVTNIGDKVLHDVVVTDTAPSSTSIVSAEGGQINGNVAVWKMRDLKPGEKSTFNVTLTTCTPGCFTNKATVNTCEGCTANCQFTTRWKGRAALEMCPTETEDVLCIGDSTRYKVVVMNKGTEPDSNVTLTLRFPDSLKPGSVQGPMKGEVNGQTVKFGPINNFAPRQSMEFNVDAQAVNSGDGRVNIELSSDAMKTPLTSQLSTIVN